MSMLVLVKGRLLAVRMFSLPKYESSTIKCIDIVTRIVYKLQKSKT